MWVLLEKKKNPKTIFTTPCNSDRAVITMVIDCPGVSRQNERTKFQASISRRVFKGEGRDVRRSAKRSSSTVGGGAMRFPVEWTKTTYAADWLYAPVTRHRLHSKRHRRRISLPCPRSLARISLVSAVGFGFQLKQFFDFRTDRRPPG